MCNIEFQLWCSLATPCDFFQKQNLSYNNLQTFTFHMVVTVFLSRQQFSRKWGPKIEILEKWKNRDYSWTTWLREKVTSKPKIIFWYSTRLDKHIFTKKKFPKIISQKRQCSEQCLIKSLKKSITSGAADKRKKSKNSNNGTEKFKWQETDAVGSVL